MLKRISIILSSLLLLSACRGGNVEPETSQPRGLDFNLVSILDVTDPAEDGARLITLSFQDKSGNLMTMSALSWHSHLEAGWYDISSEAGKFKAGINHLSIDGKAVNVIGGSMFVRKRNYEYIIRFELETEDGLVVGLADNKKLYFETDRYSSISTGANGNFLKDQVIKSEIMLGDMKYSIYLPESYDGTKKFPVLYILHGMDGNNNDWLQDNTGGIWAGGGTLPAYAKEYAEKTGKELIIVAPDGRNDFYCDKYNGGPNYMTYFFTEFIPYIETTYAIKAERDSRAIGGLSMGGYGSLYYGTLHPEMFCHVYACSAAVYGNTGTPLPIDFIKEAYAAGKIQEMPGFTIEIGTEDFLFADNEAFVKELDTYNVAYEYITRSGSHDWVFWNACSPKIIHKVLTTFK